MSTSSRRRFVIQNVAVGAAIGSHGRIAASGQRAGNPTTW